MTKWCIWVHVCTWIIDSWLFTNNFISPIASKHLLNQFYNSQPPKDGKNYILAYTRYLISLVQRQENYDLGKTRISICRISRHMRPDDSLNQILGHWTLIFAYYFTVYVISFIDIVIQLRVVTIGCSIHSIFG